MADYATALPAVLEHEGWDAFTNDPVDPGGATKWGVSLRWLKSVGDLDANGLPDGDVDGDGDVDADDIRALTYRHAAYFYEAGFWAPLNLKHVLHQDVATKIFDTAVNVGMRRGGRFAQEVVNKLRGPGSVGVDGFIGPATLRQLNFVPPADFLDVFRAHQRDYYQLIIRQKPSLGKYRRGWLRRAAWTKTPAELGWQV